MGEGEREGLGAELDLRLGTILGPALGAKVDGAVGVLLGTELNLELGTELVPTLGA